MTIFQQHLYGIVILNYFVSSGAGPSSDSPDFVFSHKHLAQMLSKVPEWARLSDTDRQKMGLDVDNDHEFW
jgi:hypothetical protein